MVKAALEAVVIKVALVVKVALVDKAVKVVLVLLVQRELQEIGRAHV